MKTCYLSIIIIILLLLIIHSAITIAIPKEVYVAIILEKYPETWELQVKNDENKKLEGVNVKEELLKFIASNKTQYLNRDIFVVSGLMALLLSGIGYYRERTFETILKEYGENTMLTP